MQVYGKFQSLPREVQYMIRKLFSKQEIEAASWFITHIHRRDELVSLVQDMGAQADCVRSHEDDDHTHLYAVVTK